MEVWNVDVIEGRRPRAVSGLTLFVSLCIHLGGVLIVFLVAWFHGLFEKKEEIIPIDLTVIVNENLDGVENEPPPLLNPPPPKPPEPPKPKTPPKPIVEPPKPLEQIVTNVVKTVDKKKDEKKPEKKKKEEKKPPKDKEKPKEDKKPKEEKKPEEKKKTKAELERERIDRMRKSVTKNTKPVNIEVKDAKVSGNGKTGHQTIKDPKKIEEMLNMGYRAGVTDQIASNEISRCTSLIEMAIKEKWREMNPKIGKTGIVTLGCKLNANGGLVQVRVVKSCGDRQSDQAALEVARRVSYIKGISDGFLAKHRKEEVTINYRVGSK